MVQHEFCCSYCSKKFIKSFYRLKTLELALNFPELKFACYNCSNKIIESNLNSDEILTEENITVDSHFRILSYCVDCNKIQKVRIERRFKFIKNQENRGGLCYNCSQKMKNNKSIQIQTKEGNCSICGIWSQKRNIAGVGLDNCSCSSINVKKATNFISTDIKCSNDCQYFNSCINKDLNKRNIYGHCYNSFNRNQGVYPVFKKDHGNLYVYYKNEYMIWDEWIKKYSLKPHRSIYEACDLIKNLYPEAFIQNTFLNQNDLDWSGGKREIFKQDLLSKQISHMVFISLASDYSMIRVSKTSVKDNYKTDLRFWNIENDDRFSSIYLRETNKQWLKTHVICIPITKEEYFKSKTIRNRCDIEEDLISLYGLFD